MTKPDVVLITGTRKGIGRFLAKHFVKKGAIVEGCSRQTPAWHLNHYTHHTVDVSSESQVKKMLSSIRERHGRLDIVINNAGVGLMNHTLLTPACTLDRVMNTNFRGTFLVCRESAKLMKKQHYGRIINFTTVAVELKLEGEAVYAASKAAVVTFTQILARELSEFGITVNAIGPTPIKTDLIRPVPPEKINSILRLQAIHRLGKPSDISNVVDFFALPESNFVTGQVIYLGGV